MRGLSFIEAENFASILCRFFRCLAKISRAVWGGMAGQKNARHGSPNRSSDNGTMTMAKDNDPPTDLEIGQAFKAYSAYNFKQKSNRAEFDLVRWVKVVRALKSGKLMAADIHLKQPSQRTDWVRDKGTKS